MNEHQALVAKAIDLYRALGHTVEDVAEIEPKRTDLVIRSSKGEKWVARCDSNPEVSSASVKLFLTHLMNYKANKAAIIASGRLSGEARDLLVGKPLEFIDADSLARLQESADNVRATAARARAPVRVEPVKVRKPGRQGCRRWVRPLLVGLLVLAAVLVVLLLAWNGWVPF
jgi:hypothetical protein